MLAYLCRLERIKTMGPSHEAELATLIAVGPGRQVIEAALHIPSKAPEAPHQQKADAHGEREGEDPATNDPSHDVPLDRA